MFHDTSDGSSDWDGTDEWSTTKWRQNTNFGRKISLEEETSKSPDVNVVTVQGRLGQPKQEEEKNDQAEDENSDQHETFLWFLIENFGLKKIDLC